MASLDPFPLMPSKSTELRLDHFDPDVYRVDSSTILYKFVDALCGDAGAGSLKKEIFIQRLSGALTGIYGSDLDYIFGNVHFLSRSPSEAYPYNPMTDMLTSDQWDEVKVKDSWYRTRIREFFAACSAGGTLDGIRMAVHAACSVDCEVMENWRYIDCADEATEILTRDGYKHYTDLEVGDEVLTLNMETGLAEWQSTSKINVFPVIDHEMLSVEMGGRHSSLTTMNHRWPVSSRVKRADGSRVYSDIRIRTSSDLSTEDRFIRAAPVTGLPEQPKYADSLVELIGWFITEGHIHAGSDVVTIVQSHAVNPDKVAAIRTALTDLIGPARETFDRTGPRTDQVPAWREWVSGSKPDITVFRLNTPAGKMLTELAPNKVASMEFVTSLTKAQLTLFLDTCIAADGHVRKDGYRSFTQKSMERIVPVQVAATLLGIPTSIHLGSGDWYVLSLCERQKFVQPLGQSKKNAQTIRYTGVVWCPTTPNGTWFARRNGSTYFTGNSFGLGSNVGRAPVSARNEVTIRPHKTELDPKERRLLRDMLDKIAPQDTIVTISEGGLNVSAPVPVRAVAADSTYYQVEKVVSGTPVLDALPDPEFLAIDLDPTEKWLFSKSPELAPYAQFNITSEYGYYYLASGGARSPIDSVAYERLVEGSDPPRFVPEHPFEWFEQTGQFTSWTEYDKADSPDNYPGGKFGIHPDAAPALNPDHSPYQFPYASQQAYITKRKAEVIALGGIADNERYRLPVERVAVSKRTYTADLAIAYSAPSRDSTVTSSWTARKPRQTVGEIRDPASFIRA
ncbi:hypothetical protein SEA_PINKCREEK_135 [Mycobacterium phage Pinkcreek]|nr:hypothetical protein SEA_PINKCREEK_135 [Mycobacterium phage Pinkcreek]